MMKLYMVNHQCFIKCPETNGRNLQTFAFYILICTHIPGENYSLWETSLAKRVNGIIKRNLIGIYSGMNLTKNLKPFLKTLMIYSLRNLHFMNTNSTEKGLNG